ncbi:MAG: septum formation initiator family protein [Lachnospiraceae bacterium]|nr:septum formation initiator family protein [Lachnospiraceae bacterium]
MTTEERYHLIYGNTARAAEPAPAPKPEKPKEKKRKKRNAPSQNSFEIEWKNKKIYLAIVLIAFMCISYVHLTSGNIQMRKEIAGLKTELNSAQIENNDLEAEIYSEVDDSEMKKKATEKLGMVKPSESHIIKYSNENKDYVRQYEAIPE